MFGASAATSEAAANSPNPDANTVRAPKRSARRPAVGIAMTCPIMKIVSTQPPQRSGAFKSSMRSASETDTIANCMTNVSSDTARTPKMR